MEYNGIKVENDYKNSVYVNSEGAFIETSDHKAHTALQSYVGGFISVVSECAW